MNYTDIFNLRGALYNQAHVLAPQARRQEVEAMLQVLRPQPEETIVVAAAGGGYDAVAIEQALFPATARILCVEPSSIFSAHIPPRFEVLNVPLDQIPLESDSVDAVVNLAAMHHIEDRPAVLSEWKRLLKPGGRLVIGDVEEGTTNALFLNTVVDTFTPGGHRGVFLEPGQVSHLLRSLFGWDDMEECRVDFSWNFANEAEMIEFTQLIFGMVNGTPEQIRDALRHVLHATCGGAGPSQYPWSLRFCQARKPALRATSQVTQLVNQA